MRLRPATKDDARLLFEWRNDPDTRAASHSSGPLDFEKHLDWLERSLRSADRTLWIAEIGGTPVGTVRADLRGTDTCELSWTVSPAARGRGYGAEMVRLAIDALPGRRIVAEVRRGNEASRRIAERCGFVLVREEDDVLHLTRPAPET